MAVKSRTNFSCLSYYLLFQLLTFSSATYFSRLLYYPWKTCPLIAGTVGGSLSPIHPILVASQTDHMDMLVT